MQDPPEPVAGGCVLGFDYGQKRIGVAVGQQVTGTASALEVIKNQPGSLWTSISALIDEWRPACVVIGLPLALDGSETDMSRECRKFARQIHGRSGLPVHMQDERFSSQAAETRFAALRAAGLRRRKDAIHSDSMAAQVLLEDWLDSNAGEAPGSA